MPSKKKKYNARFPAGRIKKIMQTDEEVGKVAQAVPVIISRALELFVESLLNKAMSVTQSRNAKTLSPSHLKQCILAESRFDFLKDLVKNIPDISSVEEREATQTVSADSSPNASRYPESRRTRVAQTSTSSLNNNTHSSDSGSDCEPINKRARIVQGNGQKPRHFPCRSTEPSQMQTSYAQSVTPPIPKRVETVVSAAQPNVPSLSGNTSQQQVINRPNRLPNFYQETLKDVDDKKEVTPVYNSVIQPNPEYSGTFKKIEEKMPRVGYSVSLAEDRLSRVGFSGITSFNDTRGSYIERKKETVVPKLHLDLSKGFPSDTSALMRNPSTTPVIHLDFSSMPLTPSSKESINNLPFTPTLIRQPQTPVFKDKIFKPENAFKPSILHRSESLQQFMAKKGPPPLKTLNRSTSLTPNVSALSSPAFSQSSEEAPIPQIRIDVTTDGQTPKFHYKFDPVKSEDAPSSNIVMPKKRKVNTPNEPPGLLPITPTQRLPTVSATPVIQRKDPPGNLQLDEDYDT